MFKIENSLVLCYVLFHNKSLSLDKLDVIFLFMVNIRETKHWCSYHF